MKRRATFVALLIAGPICVGTAEPASAETYLTTPNLIVSLEKGSNSGFLDMYAPSIDATYTWKDYMMDSDFWWDPVGYTRADQAAQSDSFQWSLVNGSYAVVQDTHINPENNKVMWNIGVYWVESGGFTVDVVDDVVVLRAQNIHFAVISNDWDHSGTVKNDKLPMVYFDIYQRLSGAAVGGNKPGVNRKSFIVKSKTPLVYPPHYNGELLRTSAPDPRFVAMGDSFSSGEGNPRFEPVSDVDENNCHRSWDAYARLLSKDASLNLGSTKFVACSGATTDDVLVGRYQEQPKQIDALSKDTKVVTITIGGNDIGFAKFAETCITGDCSMDSKAYKDAVFMINHNIPNKLTAVLRAIAQKAPNAKVYVIGYPYVTPQKSYARWPQECMYLGNTKDSEAATEVVYRLNLSIKNTVTSYVNLLSSTKFQFVSANASPHGSFNGHDICQGSNSYFHNVTPSDITSDKNRPYIFHPNKAGQNEYYKIVKGAMLAK